MELAGFCHRLCVVEEGGQKSLDLVHVGDLIIWFGACSQHVSEEQREIPDVFVIFGGLVQFLFA